MSETKAEYREGKDYDERKTALRDYNLGELWGILSQSSEKKYSAKEFREDLIEIILDHNLDLE